MTVAAIRSALGSTAVPGSRNVLSRIRRNREKAEDDRCASASCLVRTVFLFARKITEYLCEAPEPVFTLHALKEEEVEP